MISDEYAAGFFDGEGYVGLNKAQQGFGLIINIYQKRPEALYQFQERWDGTIRLSHTVVYVLKLTGSKLPFLQAILPHVIEKRSQIELALAYIAEFGEGITGKHRMKEQKERQAWYFKEFKRLKRES